MAHYPKKIPDSQSKEIMSRAYVEQLAATENWGCEIIAHDYHGVDVTLDFHGGVSLQMQLKATTSPEYLQDGRLAFSLDQALIEKWATTFTPVVLVVAVLGQDQGKWVTHLPNSTTITEKAYWKDISGMAVPTTQTKTVHFTEDDRVGPETISDWLAIMTTSFGMPKGAKP